MKQCPLPSDQAPSEGSDSRAAIPTQVAPPLRGLEKEYAELAIAYAIIREKWRQLHGSRPWRIFWWSQEVKRRLLDRRKFGRRFVLACGRVLRPAFRFPGKPSTPPAHEPHPSPATSPETACVAPKSVDTGGARIPSEHSFRVVYIGHSACAEAASIRYRAYNLIEALGLQGIHAQFIPEEDLPGRLAEALAFDLMVLVRRRWNPTIEILVRAARALGIPVILDLDDYVFDPWVLPYIDFARGGMSEWTSRYIASFRATLEHCDFFTGPTSFLVRQAALSDRPGWVIRNGLNLAQVALCTELTDRPCTPADTVRIGYFCGSKTHHADFREAYPALMRILQEFNHVRLVVVGAVDLHWFPGLKPFQWQIQQRSQVHWRNLPAQIASVDINIVPLEVNPFTEGKSNLKYYEAGILKVPTIASPTAAYAEGIRCRKAGLLARSDEEWYRALKLLVTNAALRRDLGERAHAHALREYVPAAVAAEAVDAYRGIIRHYRQQRGAAPELARAA